MKMKDYKELLQQFWAGTATEAEKLQLYKYIIEQEANAQREEPAEAAGMLAPEDSQRILASLHATIEAPAPVRKIVTLFRAAAAVAAILVAVVLVVKWPFHTTTNSLVKKNTPSSEKTITNTGSHLMLVTLTDHSQISIYPGSSISYQDTFNTGTDRLVQLKGKANFKVQHNASRPFRVIANQIVTTDIGTEFIIDALQPDIIKVKLKEGSVQVEALPASHLVINKHLQQPGEEVNINLVTKQVIAVQPFKNTIATGNATPAGKRALPAKQRLSFKRTPLAEVFARLSQREQVTIHFDKAEVEGLTFTGNIEPKDPLELSLNILCSLNGLSYTKTPNGIAITKNK